MRYFRRLPPLLRVVDIFGLLFVVAGLALLGFTSLSSSHPSFLDANRVQAIFMNLIILSLACTFTLQTYRTRLSQPDRGPLHLSSWQSQLRFIALVAALPIGALVFAFVIPQTAGAFTLIFPISIVGEVVVFVASIAMIDRR
ncbi:MAG: hypothetical protein ACXVCT_20975 [Ktedonobacterales bacterium]